MNASSTPSAATGYPIPNGRPPPPGYAYPYHAHQPPPQPAVYYDQQYLLQRQIWFRRFFASIILTCIVVFSLMVILWLIVHPRMPEVRVTSFSVSNFNVSASPTTLVSANWKASFQIYNPNKKVKISYYDVLPSVSYKGESLAETRIAPFEQSPKNLTSVDAVYSALGHYVNGKLANQINGERTRGVISFDLRIISRAVFKVYIAKRPLIRVLCDSVPVAFSGNDGSGNLTGGPKQCRVYA